MRTSAKTLRTWQKEAIDRLHKERLCKVTAFTGSGKSLAISGLVGLKLIQDPNKRAIIAVPQKDISKSWVGNEITYNDDEIFLSTSNLTKDSKSKKEELKKFLNSKNTKGKAAIVTQQLLATSVEELQDLKDVIFVLDEAHHSKSAGEDGESNRIGLLLEELAREESNEIILASATFFRGDKANILSADLESKLESYSCGFDQTIQEFKYLKSAISFVNTYKDKSFEKSLSDYINEFPERNGIIFIPPVGSTASAGKERDLQYAINAIAGTKNPKVETCAKTGFNFIVRNKKKVYFADLVSEDNDRDAIKESIDNLKDTRGSRNKLHYIIALNMFKEGSDWRDCDDAHIISQRGSLTTFVQMAGRALRDAKEKEKANIIYHIPTDKKDDCSKDDINRFFGCFVHVMIFNTFTDEKVVLPTRNDTTEDGKERKEKKMSVVDVANELGINEQELTDTIIDVTAKLAVWDSDNPNTTEEEKMDKAKSLFKEQLEAHDPDDDHLYVLAKSLLKQNRKLSKLAEKPEDFDMDMCDEDYGLFDWISSKALDADFLSKVRDYFESREWLEPDEVKDFFEQHGITSQDEWFKFRKDNLELAKNIPLKPHADSYYERHGKCWNWYVGKPIKSNRASAHEHRDFIMENGITSYKEWLSFRKKNPELTKRYFHKPHKNSNNEYDWNWFVGKEVEFLEPDEVKAFFKKNRITNTTEYNKFRTEKPELVKNIPNSLSDKRSEYFKKYKHPCEWYFDKEKIEYLKPEEVKDFFKKNGITNQTQWRKFRKDHPELVKNIPIELVNPKRSYFKKYGFSWNWYVGKE